MFELISFLGNKKSSLNQDIRLDHATIVAFLGDFILKSGQNVQKKFCCPALELFICLSSLFSCLPSKSTWKKATKCNK